VYAAYLGQRAKPEMTTLPSGGDSRGPIGGDNVIGAGLGIVKTKTRDLTHPSRSGKAFQKR
jgi:hypothetical protein